MEKMEKLRILVWTLFWIEMAAFVLVFSWKVYQSF